MNIDLSSIERSVVEKYSNEIRSANPENDTGVELNICIAETAAKIITSYFEEYLKATSDR